MKVGTITVNMLRRCRHLVQMRAKNEGTAIMPLNLAPSSTRQNDAFARIVRAIGGINHIQELETVDATSIAFGGDNL